MRLSALLPQSRGTQCVLAFAGFFLFVLIALDVREQTFLQEVALRHGFDRLEGQDQVEAILEWTHLTDRDLDDDAGWLLRTYYRYTPFYPSVDQLLTYGHPPWYGHCGTLSRTMLVLLRKLEVKAEKLQIGGMRHTVVEAEINGRQVLVDPLYNISFVLDDGRLADKSEISAGHGTYMPGISPIDEEAYRYQVRNWGYLRFGKLGSIGTVAQETLQFIGVDTRTVKLPSIYERVYLLWAVVLASATVVALIGWPAGLALRRRNVGMNR